MEREAGQQSQGMQFVLSSLEDARKRLAHFDTEEKLRNTSEIWEVYCDIEQGIEVSKFVFNLHERLGKIRPLKISTKNDPKSIPLEELRARYRFVNSAIASAADAYRRGSGEEAIEFARKARDELKILLLGRRKTERSEADKK
ncbi:MAG: hypothetical protein ACYCPP_00910 [Nitrososphaerales archaeon]